MTRGSGFVNGAQLSHGSRNLLASLWVCAMRLSPTSQAANSRLTSSLCFLLMSRKALPTDLRTCSLSSSFSALNRLTATSGLALKYGLLVQILNPSVAALLTLGLMSHSQSWIVGSA